MATAGIEQAIYQITELYRKEVLPHRRRRVQLPGRKCRPQILYTFLGFEVKAGKKRLTCPDLTTARYLKIFAEIGLAEVYLPYDPTRTARILPGLESAFQRIQEELLQTPLPSPRRQGARIRALYRRLRSRLQRAESDAS